MDKPVKRHFWIEEMEKTWQRKPILWLSGVRRTGKTTLAQGLDKIEYFDCELPSVRRMLKDPEGFLSTFHGRRIVLDEIHRLSNPAEILKIAADHYKDIRILATGSSTLGASRKFRDTLTGRKTELWLTPMISSDLKDFENENLDHRFLRGGLPPFFLTVALPERDFQEWMDAYWAKDIQELFHLERRHSFQKFFELILARSGGIFEATNFASECEVSRSTIMNYLRVLEITLVAHIIRPFSTHRPTEIISAPKVYGFDTGFICYHRGWHELRGEDRGFLWEHFVLNEIHAERQLRDIRYWRDKQGHEIDFIIVKTGQPPVTVECKWTTSDFNASNLKAFRRAYPQGENFVVTQNTDKAYIRHFDRTPVVFISLKELVKKIR